MKKQQIIFIAAAVIVMVTAGSVAVTAAQEIKPEIFIGNGLGGDITQVVISPSKKQYPKDRNCYSRNIEVYDKDIITLDIPDSFARYESFDIEVVSGGKRHVTSRGIKLDFTKGVPLLEFSKAGKESTLGLIGAATAAGGTIVFMTCTNAGRRLMVKTVYALYRYKGFAALFSMPLGGGAGGYFLGKALTAEGLDVQVVYTN